MALYITFVILTVGFVYNSFSPSKRFSMYNSAGWSSYYYAAASGFWFSLLGAILASCFYAVFSKKLIGLSQFCSFSLEDKNDCISLFLIVWTFCSLIIVWCIGAYFRRSKSKNLKAIDLIIEKDPFKKKIFAAVKEGEFLQITLKNRKVYVCIVFEFNVEDADPNKKFLNICPLRSGYRHKDDLTIEFTNDYTKFYMRELSSVVIDDYSAYLNRKCDCFCTRIWNYITLKQDFSPETPFLKLLKRFSIVVPIDEVVHIGYFDEEAYKNINQNTKNKRKKHH